MTDLDLDRLRADTEVARDEVVRLCQEPYARWRMSIPANPSRDSDLIIDKVLAAVPDLIDRLTAAEKEAAEWRRIMARPHPGDACWGAHQMREQDACMGCERDAARTGLARFRAALTDPAAVAAANAAADQHLRMIRGIGVVCLCGQVFGHDNHDITEASAAHRRHRMAAALRAFAAFVTTTTEETTDA